MELMDEELRLYVLIAAATQYRLELALTSGSVKGRNLGGLKRAREYRYRDMLAHAMGLGITSDYLLLEFNKALEEYRRNNKNG